MTWLLFAAFVVLRGGYVLCVLMSVSGPLASFTYRESHRSISRTSCSFVPKEGFCI